MEAEAEAEEAGQRSLLELPVFSTPPLRSGNQPGVAVSPLHTAASVPFRWEEQPGKPRQLCAAVSTPKCLELPPRLLYIEATEAKLANTPSPTTVLEGPCRHARRPIFQSYSFRFTRGKTTQDPSIDDVSGESNPEKRLLSGRLVVSSTRLGRDGGLFGSLRRTDFGSDGGGWTEEAAKFETVAKVRCAERKRSLLGVSDARTNFWATIYGALKQVIPWSSNKSKKYGS